MSPVATARPRSLAAEDHDLALEVGRRIRAERKRLGLTQQQIAAPRYTRAYISALENGLAKPSIAALGYLSEKIGLPMSALLAGAGGGAADHGRLEQYAEAIARSGLNVSIRVYPPYGAEDDQPDPIIDIWRTALPTAGPQS